jgi:hypothetical protein
VQSAGNERREDLDEKGLMTPPFEAARESRSESAIPDARS